MSVQSDLDASIASCATAIKEYSARLATEALSPAETYNIDGENVSYNEWRLSILECIKGLREQIMMLQEAQNALNPYVISTRHRV